MKTTAVWFFTPLVAAVCLPVVGLAQMMTVAVASDRLVMIGKNSTDEQVAWAQTFVTPDAQNTRLDQISFSASLPSSFTVYISQWNYTGIVGAPLWTSALATNLGQSGPSNVTFDTGGIDLSPAQTYALLFAMDHSPDSTLGLTSSNTYAGGQLYRGRGANGYFPSQSWNVSWVGQDLSFGTTFSDPSVPESSTIAAVFSVSLVAGLFVLRRRQQRNLRFTVSLW